MVVEHNYDLNEKFDFNSKVKSKIFMLIGFGAALFLIGLLMAAFATPEVAHHAMASVDHAAASHHAGHDEFHWTQRLWAILWVNGVFFSGISVVGLFFIAYNYVAYAGWSSTIIRIPMAMPAFLPVTFVVMVLVFAFGHHDIFHWTHDGLTDPTSPNYDKIIDGKSGFLNIPFFATRTLIYFAAWFGLYSLIRKNSLKSDFDPDIKYHDKLIVLSAVFLLIWGVTSSTSAWDWTMSIDPHWFSTMFGWYNLASWHVAGMATITLIVLLLKDAGYLKMVNENHLHDLGKFMFAFTIFWTYIWFSQFILIYYANISEETTYFMDRLLRFENKYTGFFFLNLIINFAFPFLALMMRESKRQVIILKIVSIVIICGHWFDFWLMITPGTLKQHGEFGILEIGSFFLFAGLFAYVVANSLSKAPLIAKNHPYIEESIHHNI